MDDEFIFGNTINIWHVDNNERVRIGIGMCSHLLVVFIYGPCGVENCIVILIEAMKEDCEHLKLFYLVPNVRYYISMVGIKIF
jgi:hypothetical protein